MFRYIALVWDESIPLHSSAAKRLSDELLSLAPWSAALCSAGLRVFTAGLKQGVNGAYPILGDRGVVLGKLFRRQDLMHDAAKDVSFTEVVAHQILADGGRSLVDGFWGRYVAFMRTPSGAVRILRDPSGTLPCFQLQHVGVRIFFSWLEDVLTALPRVPLPGVSWDDLIGHIAVGELSGHATALEGVKKILPGEAVQLHGASQASEFLWSAIEVAQSPAPDKLERAIERLRETVRACVLSWAGCYDSILLRLSGGIDSSILVSCLASGCAAAHVICVNYHSPGSDSDERDYARLAASKAGRELAEYERNAGFQLEQVLNVARMPAPINYVGRLHAWVDAELAAVHGAAAMFTGGGGDQLFFESRTWWPAADYLRLRGMDAGFSGVVLDAARLGQVSVWKAVRLAIGERLRPTPPIADVGQHLTLLRRDALPQPSHLGRFMHPAMLRPINLPIGKLSQARQLMHPIGYYDPFLLHAAPELVNPLLSQPLVELCLQLPTYVLAHGGQSRALARRAFAADLPPQIVRRQAKGGTGDHLKAVLSRNQNFARTMLLDGELVRRGILDRERVAVALSDRPSTLASHIAEIHRFIGIEVWLNRWSSATSHSAV